MSILKFLEARGWISFASGAYLWMSQPESEVKLLAKKRQSWVGSWLWAKVGLGGELVTFKWVTGLSSMISNSTGWPPYQGTFRQHFHFSHGTERVRYNQSVSTDIPFMESLLCIRHHIQKLPRLFSFYILRTRHNAWRIRDDGHSFI